MVPVELLLTYIPSSLHLTWLGLGEASSHGEQSSTALGTQTLITQTLSHANPTAITPEEYFNPNFELGNRDMGRPMELTTKTQK